jgi:putative Ca2+/H+ antiporter (TMEM165/GDT1 family)
MMMEGFNMPKNEDLVKLEKGHQNNVEEDQEKLVKGETPTHGHSHGMRDIQQDCEKIGETVNEDQYSSVKIFAKIFILIFASEIGDRSQISTIYLTSNFDKIIVISASIIAQNLLTILAIFGGVVISTKISERNLTLIAGATFIAFGVVASYFLVVNDLIVLGNSNGKMQIEHGDVLGIGSELIPDRKNLLPNY